MTRRTHHDDFRIDQRNGQWVVWIRSSPEDMEEYDLKEGVREILKRVRRWESSAEGHSEAAQAAEEKATELQERIDEGLEALRPLVDADVLDELGTELKKKVRQAWEYYR